MPIPMEDESAIAPAGPEGTPPPDMSTEENAPKQANPVIDALRTVGMAITALKEKGDPKATALMAAFQKLLQAFGAGASGQSQPAPSMEEGEEMPEEDNKPQIM